MKLMLIQEYWGLLPVRTREVFDASSVGVFELVQATETIRSRVLVLNDAAAERIEQHGRTVEHIVELYDDKEKYLH